MNIVNAETAIKYLKACLPETGVLDVADGDIQAAVHLIPNELVKYVTRATLTALKQRPPKSNVELALLFLNAVAVAMIIGFVLGAKKDRSPEVQAVPVLQ